MSNRPAPEVGISIEFVASLLERQHPDLAEQSLSILDRGWDNTNFRLGDDLVVRMPHRSEAADLIENEQRWLPELATKLSIAVPSPERVGHPDLEYPWKWSITRWYPGSVAATAQLSNERDTAKRLGNFMTELHRPAPSNAPVNPHRGVAIADREPSFTKNLTLLRASDRFAHLDLQPARRVFDQAVAAPVTSERVWLHGDLHGKNVIVDDGDISAIIDWGDICRGDRATDLMAAFALVPSEVSTVAEYAGADDPAWERARGWAVHFAVLYLLHSDDDPVMESMGLKLLDALAA